VIFPYVLLNVSLLLLKYVIPWVVNNVLKTDTAIVIFRLTAFVVIEEFFVASTRLLARAIPLADEAQVRPEDKAWIVLPQLAFFSYWGRILLMGITDTKLMWLANVALCLSEFVSRATVVQRDKFYMACLRRSKPQADEFWSANASGMKRFRCSLIYNHLITELLMIASASAFYLGAGISVDLWAHWYNTFIQVGTEAVADISCIYVEVVKHRLPVVTAWNNRHAKWAQFFGFFIIAINLVIDAHGGMFYCALRQPGDAEGIVMTYCGAKK